MAKIANNVMCAATAAGIERIIVVNSVYAALAEVGSPIARASGREKLAAELIMRKSASKSVTMVFLRPPVVYGHGMTGAFAMLTWAILKGIPLPLGRAQQERVYISQRNLIDLISTLVRAPGAVWQSASGRAYMPTDGIPVPTTTMIRALADVFNVRVRLLPVPLPPLHLIASMTGKTEMVSGAIDKLSINDNAALAADFGWQPVEQFPHSLACLTSIGTSVQ